MELYQRDITPATRTKFFSCRVCVLALFLATLTSCIGPQATLGTIQVQINADGETRSVQLPSGSTVQRALDRADIQIGELDRLEPPAYTVLENGSRIRVTRVSERFEIETSTIPFERQTIRNEGLPEGETILLQPGTNGTQETTYRIVIEAGEEVARVPIKTTVLLEPKAEIVMIGSQAAYTPIEIAGRLAYVSGGNAWLMQEHTGNRVPLVATGDLDGRVFRLSPDGEWLLFSRMEPEDEELINSLWLSSTRDLSLNPIDLEAYNVIHFADWSPDTSSYLIAYSTVEVSPSPPGWQANNDLLTIAFDPVELRYLKRELIPPNAGGQYGWWGSTFTWSPDGTQLAYARADSIGVVDLEAPSFETLFEIVPYQTLGDWAWVPGIAWGSSDQTLYFVDHGGPAGLEDPMAAPIFNLAALPPTMGEPLTLVEQAGIFAQPAISRSLGDSGDGSYSVAYLQAISPLRSDSSRYRLMVMDRDGSNRQSLFPPEDEPGIEPQQIVWSPDESRIALTYRGDLWIVDITSGTGQRVTGDGQTAAYDWKP